MWLMVNNSFLSIVHKECEPDELLVRARRAGDIERVFPGVKVTRSPGTDYLFRSVVKRSEVGIKLAQIADGIEYNNFKASVSNNKLHDAYARVWSVMASLQPTPPYSGTRARAQRGVL